jgi:hypothetical protein
MQDRKHHNAFERQKLRLAMKAIREEVPIHGEKSNLDAI